MASDPLGAGNQNRTDDLVITNDVLYRLSHTSIMPCDYGIIPHLISFVKRFSKRFSDIFLKKNLPLISFPHLPNFPFYDTM